MESVICWIRDEPEILRTTACVLPPQDVFVFQIKVKDTIGFHQFRPAGQHFIVDYWEQNSPPHLSEDFLIPFQDIAGSGRNRARHIIHELLGRVGIPRQKRRPLLGKIYSQAMRLAKESDVEGEYKRIPIMVELQRVYSRTRTISDVEGEYKRIPIMVELQRVYSRTRTISNEDEDEEESEEEDMEIKGLERVRVKETEVCAVCLEEMEAGSEETMLPCKHIFHGRCINAWLVKANLCPLCRFQLSYSTSTSPEIFEEDEDGWN